jgi:D-beta-D-heptose 7-phosphate kinase/D-beta-D-heptose 1-phosphate adenosyltransferase
MLPLLMPDMKQSTILVLGDVMLDQYIWGDVSRISPEAPVPIVRISKRTQALGGAGNVAANLTGLGCNVLLMGVRGDDIAGNTLALLIDEKSIHDFMVVDEKRPTTTKTRVMGQNQQLLRLDDEKNSDLDDENLKEIKNHFRNIAPDLDAVILSDYGKGLLSDKIAQECIHLCRVNKIPVFVDPKGVEWERYHGATCVTPNSSEFKQIVEHYGKHADADFEKQAFRIRKKFDFDYLLVTQGSNGMSLFGDSAKPLTVSAKAREVFDVSGAGDTVIATLAAAFTTKISMSEAMHAANVAAGLVVEKVGTCPITGSELSNALKRMSEGHASRIYSREQARTITSVWRNDRKKLVFTNGCFDLLHSGHIKLLQSAAKEGDKLVVGLNSDDSVKRLKGALRPILSETERAAILSSIECVDMVVIFEEDTPLNLIQSLKPDILVKGGDYTRETVVGYDLVESWGGEVVLVSLKQGKSTTEIVNQIKKR